MAGPQPTTPFGKVTTYGSITNNLEGVINTVATHNWMGNFFPLPPPRDINSKLSFFLHVSGFKTTGSQGAVVYRCFNNNGNAVADVLIAWSVLPDSETPKHKSQVLTLVKNVGYKFNWVEIRKKFATSGDNSEDNNYGIKSDVSITDKTQTAGLDATINLDTSTA